MATTNLGRIGFVPKGIWSAGTYKRLDFVSYLGQIYICTALSTFAVPTTATDWMPVGSFDTHSATAKPTPVDADEFALADSADSFNLKKYSWANIKTTLGSTFAALAGSATQVFSAAVPILAAHVVRADTLQKQAAIYAGTTGTNTAYVVAPTPAVAAYVDGLTLEISPHLTCGASPTINASSLGPVPLKKALRDGTMVALAAGEMGQFVNHKITYETAAGSAFVVRDSKARRSKVISGSRAIDAASGAVSYAGVGFKPSKVKVFARISGTLSGSVGEATLAAMACSYTNVNANYDSLTGSFFIYASSPADSSKYQSATLTSCDTDGMTVQWTNTGSPAAGTAISLIMFFEE